LCLRIPKLNVTQDEAADLIRQAADRGEIALPAALNTADGSFDADTLIFNLVQTSLANDGTEAGRRAAEEMSRRAFAASKAKSNKVDGVRTYLVEPGDSLAYISLLFYGKPRGYPKIFNANRNILTSPDEIQIGQRLIIPS
jgi:nucleoid-associated protein YgaU